MRSGQQSACGRERSEANNGTHRQGSIAPTTCHAWHHSPSCLLQQSWPRAYANSGRQAHHSKLTPVLSCCDAQTGPQRGTHRTPFRSITS